MNPFKKQTINIEYKIGQKYKIKIPNAENKELNAFHPQSFDVTPVSLSTALSVKNELTTDMVDELMGDGGGDESNLSDLAFL